MFSFAKTAHYGPGTRVRGKVSLFVAVILAFFIFGATGAAAADFYFKMQGIEGESRNGAYDGWVKIRTEVYVLDAESGRVTFGDGKHGRVPEAGESTRNEYRYGGGESGNSDGDPDQPVIIGSAPNPNAPVVQYRETDFNFVMSRASPAASAIMEACATGNTYPRADIHKASGRKTTARYVLHDVRCISFMSAKLKVSPGSRSPRAAKFVADPFVEFTAGRIEKAD